MAPMTLPLALPAALGHELSDKRIAILRGIGAGGSISQAARAAGVSYKAAWQAVDTLTNLAGVPLVARAVGGPGGGGAQLTPAGHELLAAADAMAQARAAVLGHWRARPGAGQALAGLAVRTSMRNHLPCTVQCLEVQGAVVRVHLALALPQAAQEAGCAPGVGEAALTARITRESAELLALAPGQPVQALCKATAVRVLRAAAGAQAPPGACRLSAKAVRVVRGQLGDEVAAELSGDAPWGLQMVGFAAAHSGMRAGSRVVLELDENALVLAQA
jgi:molybdate transport system regulatory protein